MMISIQSPHSIVKILNMKKFLFLNTVAAIIITSTMIVSQSCTPNHDSLNDGQSSYLNYEFSVDDQINVKQYEIEVSTTGNVDNLSDWTTAFILMSETGGLTHDYTAQVDVTRWFKGSNVVYSRIKTVDNDGKILYSTIQKTFK
jgi:hypothetical protein